MTAPRSVEKYDDIFQIASHIKMVGLSRQLNYPLGHIYKLHRILLGIGFDKISYWSNTYNCW